jgi:cell division protein FtsI (penicillin-binding protein 3)
VKKSSLRHLSWRARHPRNPHSLPQKLDILWARRHWMLACLVLIIAVIVARAVYLQVMYSDFLQGQGLARHLRTLPVMAHRGMLLDRHGETLAASTPVDSLWVNPVQFANVRPRWGELAQLLGMTLAEIESLLQGRMQREFVYIKRHLPPHLAKEIKALNLDGVFLQREYRRYYPAGEAAAHVVGFTNVDDQGIEGLELALEPYLAGKSGSKQVIQDRNGQIITEVGSVKMAQVGEDVRLSIDQHLQYIAHRELKAAVHQAQAKAGTAVLLDVHTGEVLAMVNQPAYNPNNKEERLPERYRNRAVTDVFEPGSTLKPFTIAAALESKQYHVKSTVDTSPGTLNLGKYQIRDSRNYGVIDLTTILQKSSNVGASKIALSLKPEVLWNMLTKVGFGAITGCGFPGEADGRLPHFLDWHIAEHATLSFGYGLNVTALQLARAYAIFGNEGRLPPVRFTLPSASETFARTLGTQVIQPQTAQQILSMLETVVQSGGTGTKAMLEGFNVAGKTGTVRKNSGGVYNENEYFALFAGIAPASQPRLVLVVIIEEPNTGAYYGGEVAAPVFAKIMQESLRLLNVPPDAPF